MKTEVILETINGNKKSILNYAYIIADMSAGSTNTHVMALDADGRDIENVKTALQDMVQSGAVYCSNGDAAHTSDYPADGEAICDAISSGGVIELDADSEDYETASAQLGLADDPTASIFAAGAFVFCPDALRA